MRPSSVSTLKAVSFPAIIFIACICIIHSPAFGQRPSRLSLPLMADLLITAPLAYLLAIRNTAIPKLTVLRVIMIGILLAAWMLPKKDDPILTYLTTWVSPLIEAFIIGIIVWKFRNALRQVKEEGRQQPDFLMHCRTVLTNVLGSERVAHLLATEVAVFYHVCSRKRQIIDDKHTFSYHKKNGTLLVMGVVLCLFLIETAGMHFLLMLWGHTVAWVFTGLSLYTCLQLWAHMKAMKARPIVIGKQELLLHNGLMGGDATVPISLIDKVEMSDKVTSQGSVVKLALLKVMEKHNVVLHLTTPVTVVKAFGIRRKADVLLLCLDQPQSFTQALQYSMNECGH